MKYLLTLIFLGTLLHSEMLIAPDAAIKNVFGPNTHVTKKNLLLTKDEAIRAGELAKTRLDTKLYRVYVATIDNITAGYGILLTKKIRTKTATLLYAFGHDGTLTSVDLIAFHEPKEYMPSASWLSQFDNVKTDDSLYLGKGVSGMTGATLSAAKITDAARLAQAIYAVKLKGNH